MQDQPAPSEVIAAVSRFLRDVVVAEASGHTAFQARVAANALEMMRRQLDLAPAAEAAERERLAALLGREGTLIELNQDLCRRIAAGEIGLDTPGLAAHLWTATIDKLAVDQPTYSAYRAALAERSGG